MADFSFTQKQQFECTAAVERSQLKRSLQRCSRGGSTVPRAQRTRPAPSAEKPDFQVTWFHGRRFDQHDLLALDSKRKHANEQRLLAHAPPTDGAASRQAPGDFRVTWFNGRKVDAFDLQARDARVERELSDAIARQEPLMVSPPADPVLGRPKWVGYVGSNHRTAADDDALDAKLNRELAERLEVQDREHALRKTGMSAARARALAHASPSDRHPSRPYLHCNHGAAPSSSSPHPEKLWVSHHRRPDGGDTLRRQAAKDIAEQNRPNQEPKLSRRGEARLRTLTEWQQRPAAVFLDPSVSVTISEPVQLPLKAQDSPAMR